jgi:hypothetical protein
MARQRKTFNFRVAQMFVYFPGASVVRARAAPPRRARPISPRRDSPLSFVTDI